jgi:hypothetical protein
MHYSIALIALAAAAVSGLGDGFTKRQMDCASLSAPLIPLNAPSGQGLLSKSLESCVTEARTYIALETFHISNSHGIVGHTFMNGLYESDNTTELTDVAFASCFGCIFTVAQEHPCAYQAMKLKSPAELLKCGLGKSQANKYTCKILN